MITMTGPSSSLRASRSGRSLSVPCKSRRPARLAFSTTATVVSTAGDATLSVSDPGHLANGAFSLAQPLQVSGLPKTYSGPVTNDVATLGFKQAIDARDPLRTGSYSKTLTFTLSTTTP